MKVVSDTTLVLGLTAVLAFSGYQSGPEWTFSSFTFSRGGRLFDPRFSYPFANLLIEHNARLRLRQLRAGLVSSLGFQSFLFLLVSLPVDLRFLPFCPVL